MMTDKTETEDQRTGNIGAGGLRPDLFRKVLIIGCPGSGKSTFARKLHDLTGLPLFYLDRLYHRPDRTTVSEEEFDRALLEILSGDRWIIDGNYLRTMEMRIRSCDTVFFPDLPPAVCLEGAASRIGKAREDLPWTETEFDPEFRQYIMDFSGDQLPRIYDLLDRYKEGRTVIIFRSRDEMNDWLAEAEQEMNKQDLKGDQG